MAPKQDRPVVVSTRVRLDEAPLLRALAELEETTVCQALYRVLVPAVRRRLAELTSAEASR